MMTCMTCGRALGFDRSFVSDRTQDHASYLIHLTIVLSSYRTNSSLYIAPVARLLAPLHFINTCLSYVILGRSGHVVDTRPLRVFLLLALKLPSQNLGQLQNHAALRHSQCSPQAGLVFLPLHAFPFSQLITPNRVNKPSYAFVSSLTLLFSQASLLSLLHSPVRSYRATAHRIRLDHIAIGFTISTSYTVDRGHLLRINAGVDFCSC